MKTVILFQGGGPLGAFGCGAWQVLSEWAQAEGHDIVAVGGSSIGALNAAIVAQGLGQPDLGAAGLEAAWRDEIASPSLPFFGWPWGDSALAAELRSWNGLLTTLMRGNGLFRPHFAGWGLWGLFNRSQQPLFDRQRMWRLLERRLPPYQSGPADVLLATFSADVADGVLRMHDSDHHAVGPAHVAASAATPLMFEPVAIEGRLQWDAELLRESPIGPLLERVRDSGRAAPGEVLQLVTIEQLPEPQPAPPRSGPEVAYRAVNLSQLGKLVPPALDDVQWIRVVRPPLPFDGISGLFDHSPERIDALIGQGQDAAVSAVAAGADAGADEPRDSGAATPRLTAVRRRSQEATRNQAAQPAGE